LKKGAINLINYYGCYPVFTMKAKMKTFTARLTTEEIRLLDREGKSRDPKISRANVIRELLSPWFAKHRREKKAKVEPAHLEEWAVAVFAIKYQGHELRKIRNEARRRGITVQALIRAVVIPEWLERERMVNRRGKPINERET
jgi:hypothetical protein